MLKHQWRKELRCLLNRIRKLVIHTEKRIKDQQQGASKDSEVLDLQDYLNYDADETKEPHQKTSDIDPIRTGNIFIMFIAYFID